VAHRRTVHEVKYAVCHIIYQDWRELVAHRRTVHEVKYTRSAT
jgi:hypothetical protein